MTGVRTELKLHKLNRALAHRNVPPAQRREILRDLKANLQAAKADVGERQALRQLGDLDAMAGDYITGTEQPRPQIRAGILAVIGTLSVLIGLTLVRIPTFGTIEVFDRHTGATTWHYQLWRLGEVGGDVRTSTLFEATVYSYAYLIFAALAFVLGSRLWRPLLPRIRQHLRHRQRART
jgi:hypothetical protein